MIDPVEQVEGMLGIARSRELPHGFRPEPETRVITCGGCDTQFIKADFAKHLKEVAYDSQCLKTAQWFRDDKGAAGATGSTQPYVGPKRSPNVRRRW